MGFIRPMADFHSVSSHVNDLRSRQAATTLSSLLLGPLLGLGACAEAPEHPVPLDLSIQEYSLRWRAFETSRKEKNGNQDPGQFESASLTQAIHGGERLLRWMDLINQKRIQNQEPPLRLSNPDQRRGIPVENPSIYSDQTIARDLDALKTELDPTYLQIVFGNEDLSSELGFSDEQFINWGRRVSRIYSSSVRWKTVILPWRNWYAERAWSDIRGMYFLRSLGDTQAIDQYILNSDQLSREKQIELNAALGGLCWNATKDQEACQRRSAQLREPKQRLQLKQRYWDGSQRVWNSFFYIRNRRSDIRWDNPEVARMPFFDPSTQTGDTRIGTWLKFHVEEEFRWGNWKLLVDFVPQRGSHAHLQFKPGVTPHVVNWNTIVMDQNQSIEEYEVQWVIRHEFGHILGLPDCYFEFYDPSIRAAVNYQIDTTDLMCSRAGDMNERIFLELKRHYH